MDEQDNKALPKMDEEASGQAVNPMAQYLDEEFGRVVPRRNEIMEGIVLDVTPNEVVVDIGCKSEGIVPGRDLERMRPELLGDCPGDTVYVYVVASQDANGNSILRSPALCSRPTGQKAEEMFEL